MSRETYICVENGVITKVRENDGYSLASRGPERVETVVTLEQLEGTQFYEEAKAALAKSKVKTRKSRA